MHEFTIVDAIIRSVVSSLRGDAKPRRVTVEIGELLGLSNESVRLAFETLSVGTVLEGSELVIVWGAGEVRCPSCGYGGSMKSTADEHRVDPVFPCPSCHSPLQIVQGNKCRILAVT